MAKIPIPGGLKHASASDLYALRLKKLKQNPHGYDTAVLRSYLNLQTEIMLAILRRAEEV